MRYQDIAHKPTERDSRIQSNKRGSGVKEYRKRKRATESNRETVGRGEIRQRERDRDRQSMTQKIAGDSNR